MHALDISSEVAGSPSVSKWGSPCEPQKLQALIVKIQLRKSSTNSDIYHRPKSGYYDCFGPNTAKWFVGENMKIEKNELLFSTLLKLKKPIFCRKNIKRSLRKLLNAGFVKSCSSLYLHQETKTETFIV